MQKQEFMNASLEAQARAIRSKAITLKPTHRSVRTLASALRSFKTDIISELRFHQPYEARGVRLIQAADDACAAINTIAASHDDLEEEQSFIERIAREIRNHVERTCGPSVIETIAPARVHVGLNTTTAF